MNTTTADSDSDNDSLFAELERDDDEFLASHRELRMEELKREMTKVQEMQNSSHGTYETVSTEKAVLNITTTTKHCVVHFAHKDFRRCQMMDTHLGELARKHFKTRFIRVYVENAPFLVERLQVKVLPCVIPFIDGVSVDRLIGFEEVGDNDNVPTSAIEAWLKKTKVIPESETDLTTRKTIFGFPDKSREDESDDDDY
ncbi:hypothetical protein SpCBS45565_g06955 [Spizellomyces sp. 'palustris']|nr:hypothetical protein SpCBS45565_g06955 [Spizellomyces sp. 'palustris']